MLREPVVFTEPVNEVVILFCELRCRGRPRGGGRATVIVEGVQGTAVDLASGSAGVMRAQWGDRGIGGEFAGIGEAVAETGYLVGGACGFGCVMTPPVLVLRGRLMVRHPLHGQGRTFQARCSRILFSATESDPHSTAGHALRSAGSWCRTRRGWARVCCAAHVVSRTRIRFQLGPDPVLFVSGRDPSPRPFAPLPVQAGQPVVSLAAGVVGDGRMA